MAYKPYIKKSDGTIADLPIQAEVSNKLGTSDVGSSVKPVYLKNGAPMPCNENLKSANEIVNLIYPVGSYFITESSSFDTVSKVQAHFGGTWTQLDEGRFLESVTSGAGTNKDAGLPNIKGYFTGDLNGSNGGTGKHTGPFYLYSTGSDSNNWGGNSGWNNTTTEGFDANRCSSVYKDDVSTVQPKSRTVYVYRRTA